MNRLVLLAAALAIWSFSATAQLSFTNSSHLFNEDYNSGGCVGISDMNGDGLDDMVHLDQSKRLVVEYQNADGTFSAYDYGNVSSSSQWGMCIGDLDQNGHNDVFSGGSFDGVHVMMIDEPGVSNLLSLAEGSMFMQCNNMADINNDGWLDAFGCNDVAESRIWGNDGTGALVPQNGWIDMATVPASDNSGNYGSVWSDVNNDGHLDLFIAKCRQGVTNVNDPRRINALFLNDGNGNFTEDAMDRGLVTFTQAWAADMADYDNDGDMDCIIVNHDNTMKLLENDGNGYFTDVTAGSGLEISGFILQVIMRDFNNDGYLDVIYAGGSDGFLLGNGDGTFTPAPSMFPYSDVMHSFAIGDLNNDGSLDVLSSYGNGYVTPDNYNDDILWMNNGNDNNHFAVNLEGTVSNRNAVGARVEIHGPWGVQIREVRSGESYGINNSFQLHFGLGQATAIDSLIIKWPAGGIDVIENPQINQTLSVIENTCIAEPAFVETDGPGVLCPGSSLTLTASPGDSYMWSTGEETQSIVVSEEGSYSVTVFSEGGCFSNSPMFFVEVGPDETPELTADGSLEFCEGESVMLTSSEAASYEWSNGETSQSIEVTQSGTYSVTVQGACDSFTSETIDVVVNPTPDTPEAEGDIIPAPGVGELNAIGTNLSWYDVPEGGEVLGTGSMFVTPYVSQTTPFYVEDSNLMGGELATGGKVDNSGSGAYHTNDAYFLIFDAYEDFILKSVVVYADGSGDRTIRVTDANDNILAEGVFDIPDGESTVELNFDVPAGDGHELKVIGNPNMYRNSVGSGVDFPYELGDMGAITGTNIDGQNEFTYYYFFYNWTVQRPITGCVSDRAEALVVVDPTVSINENESVSGISVFPVPAVNEVNLQMNFDGNYQLSMFDISGKVQLEREGVANSGNAEVLSIEGLSSGLYLVRVTNNNQTYTAKVVVK